MDKDWINGAVDQVRGSIKEAIGKITGNVKLEVEGANEKVGARAQATAADTKRDRRPSPDAKRRDVS